MRRRRSGASSCNAPTRLPRIGEPGFARVTGGHAARRGDGVGTRGSVNVGFDPSAAVSALAELIAQTAVERAESPAFARDSYSSGVDCIHIHAERPELVAKRVVGFLVSAREVLHARLLNGLGESDRSRRRVLQRHDSSASCTVLRPSSLHEISGETFGFVTGRSCSRRRSVCRWPSPVA